MAGAPHVPKAGGGREQKNSLKERRTAGANPTPSPVISSRREEKRWRTDALGSRRRRHALLNSIPSAPGGSTGPRTRSSISARTRSGFWSMTSSAGPRCLASMKNPFSASRKVSPRLASSRRTAFAAPSRPWGGFAPSPTRWASAESTPWRPRPCVAPPTGPSSPRRSRRSAASRFESSAGPKKRGSQPWA